jgi:hypothetical protein
MHLLNSSDAQAMLRTPATSTSYSMLTSLRAWERCVGALHREQTGLKRTTPSLLRVCSRQTLSFSILCHQIWLIQQNTFLCRDLVDMLNTDRATVQVWTTCPLDAFGGLDDLCSSLRNGICAVDDASIRSFRVRHPSAIPSCRRPECMAISTCTCWDYAWQQAISFVFRGCPDRVLEAVCQWKLGHRAATTPSTYTCPLSQRLVAPIASALEHCHRDFFDCSHVASPGHHTDGPDGPTPLGAVPDPEPTPLGMFQQEVIPEDQNDNTHCSRSNEYKALCTKFLVLNQVDNLPSRAHHTFRALLTHLAKTTSRCTAVHETNTTFQFMFRECLEYILKTIGSNDWCTSAAEVLTCLATFVFFCLGPNRSYILAFMKHQQMCIDMVESYENAITSCRVSMVARLAVYNKQSDVLVPLSCMGVSIVHTQSTLVCSAQWDIYGRSMMRKLFGIRACRTVVHSVHTHLACIDDLLLTMIDNWSRLDARVATTIPVYIRELVVCTLSAVKGHTNNRTGMLSIKRTILETQQLVFLCGFLGACAK